MECKYIVCSKKLEIHAQPQIDDWKLVCASCMRICNHLFHF